MVDIERVWETIIALLLAFGGGLARLLTNKDTTKFKARRVLAEFFLSGFAGYMGLLVARILNLSGDWLGLICGIAGYLGAKFLDAVSLNIAEMMKKIGGGNNNG